MESRHDENVEDAGFLESDGFVAVDEGTVAEEHGAQCCCGSRIGGKQRVNFIAESRADSINAVGEGLRRSSGRFLEELRGAKCCDHVDVLSCEVGAAVEGAFVAEEWRELRFSDQVDCIAGVELRQKRGVGRGVRAVA